MTQSQEIVLKLIRVAVSGVAVELPAADVNWQEVFDIAIEHGIHGLCIDAFELLTADQRPPMDFIFNWFGQVSLQESKFEHSWNVACELSKLWGTEGVVATMLKGRSIAQYYPHPNHRYSCDLDVFISDEKQDPGCESDWEKACRLLKGKGIELEYEVYKEVEFSYDGVYVECHRYITPVRGNKNLLQFERYLRSLLSSDSTTFDGTALVCPPCMFTALLYVEHALGDFLRGPLTLKHIADWMVLRKQDVDWTLFNEKCKEFGFERFLHLVDFMADMIEGKADYELQPSSYKRAFDEIFERRKVGSHKKSWTERRVNQFFNVIKCRWKYKAFGYSSMRSYLSNVLWAHWFDKEVEGIG